MAHTTSRIPRVEYIAFACGSSVCQNGQKCKTGFHDLTGKEFATEFQQAKVLKKLLKNIEKLLKNTEIMP